jgi:hypothetical protein
VTRGLIATSLINAYDKSQNRMIDEGDRHGANRDRDLGADGMRERELRPLQHADSRQAMGE